MFQQKNGLFGRVRILSQKGRELQGSWHRVMRTGRSWATPVTVLAVHASGVDDDATEDIRIKCGFGGGAGLRTPDTTDMSRML